MMDVVILDYGKPWYHHNPSVLREAMLCAIDNADSPDEVVPFTLAAYDMLVTLIAETN